MNSEIPDTNNFGTQVTKYGRNIFHHQTAITKNSVYIRENSNATLNESKELKSSNVNTLNTSKHTDFNNVLEIKNSPFAINNNKDLTFPTQDLTLSSYVIDNTNSRFIQEKEKDLLRDISRERYNTIVTTFNHNMETTKSPKNRANTNMYLGMKMKDLSPSRKREDKRWRSVNKNSTIHPELVVIVYYKENIEHQRSFMHNNCPDGITIGRSKECDILVNDMVASKVQCTVKFDYGIRKWVVFRGGANNSKISPKSGNNEGVKNPIWVSLSRQVDVYNGMVFKFNGAKIKCEIGEGQNSKSRGFNNEPSYVSD